VSKKLVAWFSVSGVTARVAREIAIVEKADYLARPECEGAWPVQPRHHWYGQLDRGQAVPCAPCGRGVWLCLREVCTLCAIAGHRHHLDRRDDEPGGL